MGVVRHHGRLGVPRERLARREAPNHARRDERSVGALQNIAERKDRVTILVAELGIVREVETKGGAHDAVCVLVGRP